MEGLGDDVGVVGGDVLREERPLPLPERAPVRVFTCGLVLVDVRPAEPLVAARPAELLVGAFVVFGL